MIRKLISQWRFKRRISKLRKSGLTIGEGCRLGEIRWGSEPWLITIGNHVTVGIGVEFATHDGSTWVFRHLPRYKNVIRFGKIVVGDNCFIGSRAMILPGVTIGENSVIGACSLVNKDVKPNSVYAGVPARYICSIEEYAEKCLRETPEYDVAAYRKDKRKEVLRMLDNMS